MPTINAFTFPELENWWRPKPKRCPSWPISCEDFPMNSNPMKIDWPVTSLLSCQPVPESPLAPGKSFWSPHDICWIVNSEQDSFDMSMPCSMNESWWGATIDIPNKLSCDHWDTPHFPTWSITLKHSWQCHKCPKVRTTRYSAAPIIFTRDSPEGRKRNLLTSRIVCWIPPPNPVIERVLNS